MKKRNVLVLYKIQQNGDKIISRFGMNMTDLQRVQNKCDGFVYIIWPVHLVAVVILEESKTCIVCIVDLVQQLNETKLTHMWLVFHCYVTYL